MKKHKELLLSLISGILLASAWPTYGCAPLLFIAFIPLFIIENNLVKYTNHGSWLLFRYSIIAFLIFNVITTWWVGNAAVIAGVLACAINTILMALVFQLYHFIRVAAFGKEHGQIIFIAFWIGFEKLHYTWELNWPWLNLGNAFATYTPIIQWYEYTGVFGGTLWVLLVNCLLYRIINDYYIRQKNIKTLLKKCMVPILVIIVPIITSLIIYYTYKEEKKPVNIVVYQPNSDPWSEEFDLTANEVVNRFITRTEGYIDNKTDFILCPESMMQEQTFEKYLYNTSYIQQFRKYLREKAPNAGLIIGASTCRIYERDEKKTYSAREMNNSGKYYDAYNTTIYIDTTTTLQVYHKSKLTPGVEMMPYIKYMPFIEKLAFNLGGTVGTLGTDSLQLPFRNQNCGGRPASVICYESVFGEHVSKFIENGANIIFISTNDGWWKDTQGYRQHCAYARILAIEMRRDIARSANTGTSCTINQRGDISNKTQYWTPAVFKATLNLNEKDTFYAKYGDYLSHIAIIVIITITMIAIINRIVINKVSE